MKDIFSISGVFAQSPDNVRVRLGTVSSVGSDYTITVAIGGSATTVSGIKYLNTFAPCVGKVVWLLTDGVDLIAVGHVAQASVTLSARLYKASDTTISHATNTQVIFGQEEGGWGTRSGGNFVAPITGRYMATGYASFVADATGIRNLWIENGSGTVLGRQTTNALPATSDTYLSVATHTFTLTKGDTLGMWVRQTSGGNLTLQYQAGAPSLSVIYLGA